MQEANDFSKRHFSQLSKKNEHQDGLESITVWNTNQGLECPSVNDSNHFTELRLNDQRIKKAFHILTKNFYSKCEALTKGGRRNETHLVNIMATKLKKN